MSSIVRTAFLAALTTIALSDAVRTQETKNKMRVLELKTLSTRGSTRGTAYAMSNKIITANGKMFIAWLDHVAHIKIQTYHIDRQKWDKPILLGKGVDNHSGPAITIDSEGYLYAVFGPHVGSFQFRRSKAPYDASEWGPIERFGVRGTYPSLVCGPDNTLHCTYRGGQTPLRLMYQRRPKDGKWSEPLEVVHPGVKDGYTQYGNPIAISADNTLHLGFHIYDVHPAGGKALGYLCSPDGGQTWETVSGEKIELPARPTTPCFIEQGASLDMRIGDLALGPEGRPYLTVVHFQPKPSSAKMWRHDGESWKCVELLPVVRKLFPDWEMAMAGTLTYDRDGRLYIATVIQRPPGGWGHPSQEIVLLTSDDRGETFNVMPISNVDPKLPCWLPSIERPFSPKAIGVPSLLYTHGGPGEGVTGGDATEIVFVRIGEE